MVQIGERPLEARVAPRTILGRNAHHAGLDLGHHVGSSGPAPATAIVLAGDEADATRAKYPA